MATRNPVSVLPEPVGEATRTSRPSAMCGQAAVWGGVGPAGKRRANQLATAGWNNDSGDGAVFTVLFHQDACVGRDVARGQAGGRRPQHEIMGGWARSRCPARTLARWRSISSAVAIPASSSWSRISLIVATSR